jgi:hypothetical protein
MVKTGISLERDTTRQSESLVWIVQTSPYPCPYLVLLYFLTFKNILNLVLWCIFLFTLERSDRVIFMQFFFINIEKFVVFNNNISFKCIYNYKNFTPTMHEKPLSVIIRRGTHMCHGRTWVRRTWVPVRILHSNMQRPQITRLESDFFLIFSRLVSTDPILIW